MIDPVVDTYRIQWKGRDLGERSLPHLREELSEGKISRMHQVLTDEGWMTIDEFLRRVDDAEERERQRKQATRRLERAIPIVAAPTETPTTAASAAAPWSQLPPMPPPYHGPTDAAYEGGSTTEIYFATDPGIPPVSEDSPAPSNPGFSWSRKTAWWILVTGTLPFLIGLVLTYGVPDVRWMIWTLQGYFSMLLAGYFYALSRVTPQVAKKGAWFVLFTIAVGTPILAVAQQWSVIAELLAGTQRSDLGSGLPGFILGVGVSEELCKALPLLFFCLRRGSAEPRDLVYLGFMSGLGFAFSEGGLYTFTNAANVVATDIISTVKTLEESTTEKQLFARLDKLQPQLMRLHLLGLTHHLVRLISLPILHGAWTGCVGWFVSRASEGRPWANILIGISLAALTHGVYDIVVAGYFGNGVGNNLALWLIAAASIFMFASLLLGRRGSDGTARP